MSQANILERCGGEKEKQVCKCKTYLSQNLKQRQMLRLSQWRETDEHSICKKQTRVTTRRRIHLFYVILISYLKKETVFNVCLRLNNKLTLTYFIFLWKNPSKQKNRSMMMMLCPKLLLQSRFVSMSAVLMLLPPSFLKDF